jgi:hypothetical protein
MREAEARGDARPAVVVHATPGAEVLVAEALREAGLEADIGDSAFAKSLEAPHSVLPDVESWCRAAWPYVAPLAWPIGQKIYDGAVGEIGAEALHAIQDRLRRLGRAARTIAERSGERGAIVKVRAVDYRGEERTYFLPAEGVDAATEAILADLRVEVVGRPNSEREWVADEECWAGVRDLLDAADAASAGGTAEPAPDPTMYLPTRETFAALEEVAALLGRAPTFEADALVPGAMHVALPEGASDEDLREAVRVFGRHLPASVVGLDLLNGGIFVAASLERR